MTLKLCQNVSLLSLKLILAKNCHFNRKISDIQSDQTQFALFLHAAHGQIHLRKKKKKEFSWDTTAFSIEIIYITKMYCDTFVPGCIY